MGEDFKSEIAYVLLESNVVSVRQSALYSSVNKGCASSNSPSGIANGSGCLLMSASYDMLNFHPFIFRNAMNHKFNPFWSILSTIALGRRLDFRAPLRENRHPENSEGFKNDVYAGIGECGEIFEY